MGKRHRTPTRRVNRTSAFAIQVARKAGLPYRPDENYVILYFKEEGSVVITHLLHQSQDYAAIVLNGE